MIDNTLSTIKTIFLSKDRYISASIANAVGTLFYLMAIVKIAQSSSLYSMLAMCLATLLGTLIPSIVIKKSEKEKLWKINITSDNLENGKQLADILRDNNFAVSTKSTYNKYKVKALEIDVYCKTKAETKAVKECIPQGFDINVIIPYKNKADFF